MRPTYFLTLVCTFVAIASFIGNPPRSSAADAPPALAPRQVMEKIIGNVIAILRDPNLSTVGKRTKVQQIAFDNIDFQVMARLSLGRPWRDITDDQRTRYSAEFKQHVTNTYGHTTDDYNNEDVNIVGDHQESDGDWTVQTSIVGSENGGPRKELAKVDYRLRKQDDQWKVIDFTVDGVSLIANFRAQFQEIFSNGGIEQLIQLLHDKNVANDKDAKDKNSSNAK
jgi:phospholipid transport system substrate-binding protein